MYEKKFLAYILYITLLEIREKSYAEENSRLYYLIDMLHNVPFSLLNDEDTKMEYIKILDTVEALGIYDWLNNRRKEFSERFPAISIDALL